MDSAVCGQPRLPRPMKAYQVLLVLANSLSSAGAAPGDRFHGGSGDGSDQATFLSYSPPVGGEFTRYTGGGHDGSDSGTFQGWSPPLAGNQVRFQGGHSDGFATSSYQGWSPPVAGQDRRFLGAGFDGHASSGATAIPNPLSGDLDGDGVPDWWESFHYRSLVLADANTDLDHDGRGSLHEYIWDTDPTDPLSRFNILGIVFGEDVSATFSSSSPNRQYRIESSPDLRLENWAPLATPAVPGNGGELELTAPWTNTPRAFLRITVAPR